MKVVEFKIRLNFLLQQVFYVKIRILIGEEWDFEIWGRDIWVDVFEIFEFLDFFECVGYIEGIQFLFKDNIEVLNEVGVL